MSGSDEMLSRHIGHGPQRRWTLELPRGFETRTCAMWVPAMGFRTPQDGAVREGLNSVLFIVQADEYGCLLEQGQQFLHVQSVEPQDLRNTVLQPCAEAG